MKVRWTGDGDRLVPHDGDEVAFERLKWVDVPADLARSLAKQDGYELEKRKRTDKDEE